MARKTISEQLTESIGTIADLRGQLEMAVARESSVLQELSATRVNLDRAYKESESTAKTNLVLQARVEEAEDKLAKMTKDLESKASSNNYNNQRAEKAEAELEQIHAVLDGVADAPTREYEQEYGRGKRTVITRLTGAFLAIVRGQA